MLESIASAALEVEQARLEGLVALVFDQRHYRHDCDCSSCVETRRRLSVRDRDFINKISCYVYNSPDARAASHTNGSS